MLNGHVFKNQRFGNQICALVMNTFLDGHNGIFNNYKNSMELTYNGSNVTINSGAIFIQGRPLEEDSSTTLNAGTNTLYCKLVIEIDLDKDNTITEFNQAKYKILVGEVDYPNLTQDDIVKNNSGIYQYELASFRTGLSGIIDFVDNRTFLDFDSIYALIDKKIKEVEDGSIYALKEDLEDIEQRITDVATNINKKLSLTGGTLTGKLSAREISPSKDRTYDLGTSGYLWRNLYLNYLHMTKMELYNSGDTTIMGVVNQLSVRKSGNINAFMPISASSFNVNSSKRYKKNIKKMTEEEANKLDEIEVDIFDYKVKENGTNVAGVIAEDVYEILPNVVTLTEIDGKEVPDSVDYSKFVPYLIKKIQMQDKRISELENIIKKG